MLRLVISISISTERNGRRKWITKEDSIELQSRREQRSMDKEKKNQSSSKGKESAEHDLLLQWGNRKRLRCMRVKDPDISGKFRGGIRMKIISQFLVTSSRSSEGTAVKVNLDENRKSPSPEEEEKCYKIRGKEGLDGGSGKGHVDLNANGGGEDRDSSWGIAWPKLFITLSSKEKEEDFLAMKWCKPPQRPKKRAKIIQRSLLRTRGLKSMGGVETGSE